MNNPIGDWTEDQVYEEFLDIIFEEFTQDELAYAHVVQSDAINEENGHA